MFYRPELQVIKKRVLEPRKFIQVIMGPRQVGKTTVVNQLLNQVDISCDYQSADDIAAGNNIWLEQIWEAARLKVKNQKLNEFLLIIDEIQKISNWSETIKKLWDDDSVNNVPIKVILLGSSRLLLQQGLTESLAGRFETIYMTHWSYDEMNQAFGWDANTFAWFGGYPGSAKLINQENRWKKYIRDSIIETSISKDILMLSRIDKPALLKNLFELSCVYSSQVLSFTKIQGQLQDAGNTTTLSHYLGLLHTAGLLGGLEKYAHTTIRKRASSPKFQVHNNALLTAQSLKSFEEVVLDPKEWGKIIESAVGAHLLNEAIRNDFKVYYWRDRNYEVDFVLEMEGKVVAIEIKSSYAKNNKGMEFFRKKFNPSKIYLIDKNGITWNEFLKINPKDLF